MPDNDVVSDKSLLSCATTIFLDRVRRNGRLANAALNRWHRLQPRSEIQEAKAQISGEALYATLSADGSVHACALAAISSVHAIFSFFSSRLTYQMVASVHTPAQTNGRLHPTT